MIKYISLYTSLQSSCKLIPFKIINSLIYLFNRASHASSNSSKESILSIRKESSQYKSSLITCAAARVTL